MTAVHLVGLVLQHIQPTIRGRTTMDDSTIINLTGRDMITDPLTDLLRKGARELLQAAIEAERDAFLAEFSERRTADGRAAVVGSGYHPERAVQTGIGPVTIKPRDHQSAKGPSQGRQTGHVPLCTCSALRAQSQVHRGGLALVVPEGDFFGRNGRRAQSTPWP